MTTWLDTLHNPQGITSIYGDAIPTLNAVDLHEICLHRDGPDVVFRFDLPEYPSDPPRKWAAQGFNTVQVRLQLVAVTELSIAGWSHNSIADITVAGDGDMVTLNATAEAYRCHVRARAAAIKSISAYLMGSGESGHVQSPAGG